MSISLGNDISKWQGDVNFDVFKNNAQFVIFKATEGNGLTDTKFSRNQSEARRVGLLLGYYHFARPDLLNTPEAEADYFLKIIGALREGELLTLDYECANQKQSDVEWCKRWLDRVQSATGVKPLIYLNQSQVKAFDWQSVINGGYGLWIASYTGDPNKNDATIGKWSFAAMQQWTNKQTVPGISGGVDGDVFFGDLATLKKYGYKIPVTPPTPTVEPIVTDDKAIIRLGKINELEYGDMRLEDLKRGLGERDIEIKNLKIELTTKNTDIETLTGQVTALKGQVGVFDNMVSAIKKAFGL